MESSVCPRWISDDNQSCSKSRTSVRKHAKLRREWILDVLHISSGVLSSLGELPKWRLASHFCGHKKPTSFFRSVLRYKLEDGSTLTMQRRHLIYNTNYTADPLQWRHNDHDSVTNHQPHDCLLNRLFRRRSKKASKLRVAGLCAGNSPGTGEKFSIWWRHHVHERVCSCLVLIFISDDTRFEIWWVIIVYQGRIIWP